MLVFKHALHQLFQVFLFIKMLMFAIIVHLIAYNVMIIINVLYVKLDFSYKMDSVSQVVLYFIIVILRNVFHVDFLAQVA